MHFAQTSTAVHWCWVTTHLYEQQISIDVIAVTQATCFAEQHWTGWNAFCQSQGVVSSSARSAFELRGPYDVINMATPFGLLEQDAKVSESLF